MCTFEGYLRFSNITAPNTGAINPTYICAKEDGGNTYVYTFSLPRSAIHCPWISKIKVSVAFKLTRRILESNTFSKDNVNNVSVNTESDSDHIYSGIMSMWWYSVTPHLHDNHTPLLEHCASKKCNIWWADENDA